MEPVTVCRVAKRTMLRGLHAQPGLSEMFTALLLKRNMDLSAPSVATDVQTAFSRTSIRVGPIDQAREVCSAVATLHPVFSYLPQRARPGRLTTWNSPAATMSPLRPLYAGGESL